MWGPNTVPGGTPERTGSSSDLTPSVLYIRPKLWTSSRRLPTDLVKNLETEHAYNLLFILSCRVMLAVQMDASSV